MIYKCCRIIFCEKCFANYFIIYVMINVWLSVVFFRGKEEVKLEVRGNR